MLAECAASLVRMAARLGARGIPTEFRTHDGYDLILARNLLTHAFLASDCTHLVFVDSDMAFPADLVERLLAAEKPLVGLVYPRRTLDLAKLKRLAAERALPDALALAHAWNVHFLPGPLTVRGGLCQVAALPGGFLMIARACFERMAEEADVPAVRLKGVAEPVRAFFRDTHEGEALTDLDYSFCRRWRECGGEVWAYADGDIRHIGDYRAAPPFSAMLRAVAERRATPARP